MRSSLWEFGAILRHEQRRIAEGARPAPSERRFAVPAFLSDTAQRPADPATLDHAESDARAQGWIAKDNELDQRWQEIVDALGYASVWGFVRVTDPSSEAIRAVTAVRRNSAFLITIRGERVSVDEIRADAPWPALVGCLPERTPAVGEQVTVPTAVWADASAAAERYLADRGDGATISYELRQRDVPAADAEAVGTLMRTADQVSSRVSVAIRVPRDSVHTGPFAISVRHAPSGRVAVLPQIPEGDRTMVAPADDVLLIKTLQEYIDDLLERFDET